MAGKGKDTVATWAVDVETNDSVDAVELLAKELQSLRDEMGADRRELGAMNQAYANLRKGGAAFEGQAKALKQQIDLKSHAVAAATVKYQQLGGRLEDIGKKVAKPKQELSAMRQVLLQMQQGVANSNGALGRMSTTLGRVFTEMSKTKIIAVAATAALVALGAAASVFAKHMYDAALASQDARRSELLHIEALTRVRNLYGPAAGNSKEMQQQLDRIAPTVSIARGELAQLQQQLYQGGMRGKTLGVVLEAAAIKASALGSQAGSAFAGFANDVRLAGGSAARAAQDIKNRFGDVVQAKMKSVEIQALKTKENIDSLFSGLDIEPLLTAKKQLNDMFSQATASGRAFKSLATTFLQPLISAVETGFVVVRRFFKQMLIGVLELTQAYLVYRVAFHKAFGGPEVQGVWGKLFTGLQLGRVFVYMLAVGFAMLAASVISATWPFLLAAAAIYGLVKIVELVWAVLTEPDWSGIGSAIWKGIVRGLKQGWTAIRIVASDLANELGNAFKVALGIQSPSKVFAEYGVTIPQGVAQGIQAGSPDAKRAAANLVDKPIAVPLDAGPASKPAAIGGGVTTGDINITIAMGDQTKAQDIARTVRRELEATLAGLAEQLGAPRGVAA